MKNIFLFLFILFTVSSVAQTADRRKIAIFTPLYLDSAFDAGGNFKHNEKNYARYVNAGLEFYIGAQMAIDSLQKRGAPLEVQIVDSRSKKGLSSQLNDPGLNDVEMIIAQSNSSETKMLADFAQRKRIPFISASYPNDAGVSNNPYFVILNSTLQTHIEGIYQFLQSYYPLDNIVVFTQNGTQEGQIKDYFTDMGKTTNSVPLKVRFVNVSDISTPTRFLDSTKKNIIIAGSMDESFGTDLSAELTPYHRSYPITLIGMPTWANFNFSRPEFNNLEIIYSTPFNYSKTTSPLTTRLSNEFNHRMSINPGEMFYRGYEASLRFALLLLDTKKDVASSLTRKGNTIITPFDIQPVFKDRNEMALDYFENKKLFFIKVLGGARTVLY